MRWLAAVVVLGFALLIWTSGREGPQQPADAGTQPETGSGLVDTRPVAPPPDLPGAPPATLRSSNTGPLQPGEKRLVAHRRYEQLMNGSRAGALDVSWYERLENGRRVIEDVTVHRERTVRMMGPVKDLFESTSRTVTVRTPDGDLLSSDSTTRQGRSRIDRATTRRTATGYHVRIAAGPNEDEFDVPTATAAKLDCESFLGRFIRDGTAVAGKTWTMPVLHTQRKRLIEVTLTVTGRDESGWIRVVEEFEGNRTLWWFDADGAVRRMVAGTTEIRRDDAVTLDSLPRRPATFRVTLPTDVAVPRIFTGKSMVVDVVVSTNETIRLPEIGENPFTSVVEKDAGRIRLLLTSHDAPDATTTLPVNTDKFAEYLKPTRVMEVDHPRVKDIARRFVRGSKDAREAATRLASGVFHMLVKQSPEIGEPTALQILQNPIGDCSEHALLFTALCRAAGIPARRCSGWVCIGDDWGAHAWTEIWLGEWIGADPTTNEIGTRARYIMLRRPDEPEYRPARITAERTSIQIIKARYADGEIDFRAPDAADGAVRTGVRLDDLPAGWSASYGSGSVTITGSGFRVSAEIQPDHGYRAASILRRRWGRPIRFGTSTAYQSRRGRRILVPLGREHLVLTRRDGGTRALPLKELAAVLEPTLTRNG
ncbi:MAG: transglutaminase domain-containing protein [Planctomycetota bacterium]|nr:transglutaminase domain-containing protein [Planctomycetota bacterium]